MKNNPNKIIVHHSADSFTGDQLAKINEYHKGKNFPISSFGYYVGYHYLINRKGITTKTRAHDDEGAHCIGENTSSIGICIEGNFDTSAPSQEQIDSLQELLLKLSDELGISWEQVYSHRHFRNTSCYGSRLDNNWGKRVFLIGLIDRLKKQLQCLQLN